MPSEKKISLNYSFSIAIGLAVLVVAALAIGVHYFSSVSLAKEAAQRQFQSISDMVSQRAQITDNLGYSLTEILAQSVDVTEPLAEDSPPTILRLMSGAMSTSPYVSAMFVAYPNGDFVRLTNLDAAKDLYDEYLAAPEDRWIESRNVNGQSISRYLDDDFIVRTKQTRVSDYDPRIRPWYKMATTKEVTETPPFVSFGNDLLVAYVKRLESGEVVGVSFSLSYLSALLEGDYLTNGSQAFLFDNQGTVTQFEQKNIVDTQGKITLKGLTPEEKAYLASSPTITVGNLKDYPPIDFSVSGKPKGYAVDYLKELIKTTGLKVQFVNGVEFSELMTMFAAQDIDLMLSMFVTEERATKGTFSAPILDTNLVVVSQKNDLNNYTNLNQLINKTLVMPKNYSTTEFLLEQHPTIRYVMVENPIEALRAIENGEADATLLVDVVARHIEKYYFMDNLKFSNNLQNAETLPTPNYHLYVNKHNSLLSSVLNKAQKQVPAVKLAEIKRKWLVDLNTQSGQPLSKIDQGSLPSQVLLEIALDPSQHKQVVETSISGDAYFARVDPIGIYHSENNEHYLGVFLSQSEISQRFLSQVYWAVIISVIGFLLLLPLVYVVAQRIAKPIHRLTEQSQLIEQKRYADVTLVRTGISELERLSQATVHMAKTIESQNNKNSSLINSFVRLIGKTIDKRSTSPVKKQRIVPQMAMALAKAAKQHDFPEADAELATQSQWREFEIATWLHDCGKVATPEHIANKQTKLEALHNRIHEIRMRFEVLLRDAEINMYKHVLAHPDTIEPRRKVYEKMKRQLQHDFKLVANCNLGKLEMNEFLNSEIDRIANYRYENQFDRYLGMSDQELEHVDTSNEYQSKYDFALNNRPEHITFRAKQNKPQPILGFELFPPENKMNLGEIYNLKIPNGVLTNEEKFIIDKQMIGTLATINELDLPSELQQIPEIVSGKYQISLQSKMFKAPKVTSISIKAKILAIANVYIELVHPSISSELAKDSQQALEEMKAMCEKGLIDKGLFELFLQTKVYELDFERMT